MTLKEMQQLEEPECESNNSFEKAKDLVVDLILVACVLFFLIKFL